MAKGKYAARAANRRSNEELEDRLAGALLAQVRAEEERDRLKTLLTNSRIHWEDQQRALLIERDTATSPRVVEMQEQIARLRSQLEQERSDRADIKKTHDKLFTWMVEHLKTDHPMTGVEAIEALLPVVGCVDKVLVNGVFGDRKNGDIADPDMAVVVQRARGLRK